MTARRHRHYRRALEVVAALEDGWLPAPGREILADLAEQMLLSRESDPVAIRELRREVEVAVGELALVGVLPRSIAVELTQLFMGAGPPVVMEVGTAASRRSLTGGCAQVGVVCGHPPRVAAVDRSVS